MRAIVTFVCLIFFTVATAGEIDYPLTVDLNHPQYVDGVISTTQGGVISSPRMRLQAQKIFYTYKLDAGKKHHTVLAEGNLLFERDGAFYVGEKLEFDFTTKTGFIYGGKTRIDFWFISGETIQIHSDDRFSLTNARLTTSENANPLWTIQARQMEVSQRSFLEATGATTVRFATIPIFYLPPLPYKANLKSSSDSVVSYILAKDTGLWPLVGLRYRLYASSVFSLFASLNLRPSKGIQGTVESRYLSKTNRSEFLTRSYADHDTFYRDEDPDQAKAHYRFQGLYTARSANQRSSFDLQYDYLSDKNLQTDFVAPQFEFDTNKETKLHFLHLAENSIFSLNSLVRVNSFQTLKQELPSSFWHLKPLSLGQSQLVMESSFAASYLSYTFAHDLNQPGFDSGRFATTQALYRAFFIRGFSITPLARLYGIFYTKTQTSNAPSGQAVLEYECLADFKLRKHYGFGEHTLIPYAHYRGLTSPTLALDHPYIFSIRDGYDRLNLVRFGLKQLVYLSHSSCFPSNFTFDLYGYAFFNASTFRNTIPKLGFNASCHFPSFEVTGQLRWNQEQKVFDTANLAIAWTINRSFAFKTELRHRSRFYWRRNSPDNFIFEVARPIAQLRNSPLSDKRTTLMSRLQMKIAPQWIARVESHIGWGRDNQPDYNAVKVDLFTTISTSWQLHMTLIHSPSSENKDTRFVMSLALGAKPNLTEKLGTF